MAAIIQHPNIAEFNRRSKLKKAEDEHRKALAEHRKWLRQTRSRRMERRELDRRHRDSERIRKETEALIARAIDAGAHAVAKNITKQFGGNYLAEYDDAYLIVLDAILQSARKESARAAGYKNWEAFCESAT